MNRDFSLKALIEKVLEEEGYHNVDSKDFALWAFGEGYSDFTGSGQFMVAWNRLHRNEYHVNAGDKVMASLRDMIRMWREVI